MIFVILPQHAGIWPDGEPQSVRDAADGNGQPQPYEVHLVVIGTETYQAIAAYEDSDIARMQADIYNDLYASRCGHPECRAHVEEISFYPAGTLPLPFTIFSEPKATGSVLAPTPADPALSEQQLPPLKEEVASCLTLTAGLPSGEGLAPSP